MTENPTEATIDENPELVIWESKHWVAMLDKYPIVEGHTLILPKKEISHVTELTDEVAEDMGLAIRKIAEMLKRVYGSGILVTMKCGEGSARTVSHLHIHVIPRKRGDRLWDGDKSRIVLDRTSGFPRLESGEEELKKVAEKIRGEK